MSEECRCVTGLAADEDLRRLVRLVAREQPSEDARIRAGLLRRACEHGRILAASAAVSENRFVCGAAARLL